MLNKGIKFYVHHQLELLKSYLAYPASILFIFICNKKLYFIDIRCKENYTTVTLQKKNYHFKNYRLMTWVLNYPNWIALNENPWNHKCTYQFIVWEESWTLIRENMIGTTIANTIPTVWIRKPAKPSNWKCITKWSICDCFNYPRVQTKKCH